MTFVESESNTLLCGFPTTSIETIGSVQNSRMPFIGPSAAAFIAALISSLVVLFLVSTTRSTREPSGAGTRTASPSSLPLSSGSTSPMALAAPVEVGIMLIAAARARRRSLCGRSRIFWSLV